jgi:spore germination protein KC
MSKGFIKFIFAITIIIIFMYAFSASYSANNIDNISYVTALGVDLGEEDNSIIVTFEFTDVSNFSSESSSKSDSPIIDTVTSTSINSAINLLNSYVGKGINMSHCKVIVISQNLAEKGIKSEITELMNNIQIRPTTNLIISKCTATEYLQNSTSALEKVLTKYYDIFPNSSEYTGYTSNIQIGKFYKCLTDTNCGNLAILGGLNELKISTEESSGSSSESSSEESSDGGSGESSSSGNGSTDSSSNSESSDKSNEEIKGDEIAQSSSYNISLSSISAGNSPIIGDRGTENIGLAVFNQDTYIGELSAMDTLCHTLISGEVDAFLFKLDDSEIYPNYMDINLFANTEPEISVDISEDNPTININIKLTGRIVGIKDSSIDSSDNLDLDLEQISNAVNKYLESYITAYLNKTTSEFKCDLDDFYTYAKRNFLTTQKWEDYDWKTKYLNSKFNVSVDADVFYSLLNSD